MADAYSKQDRGRRDAYEAYFAGMDKSMQQKIALTTAHFPTRGRIADMGSGSGRGTYDLACLYEGLELVGVDINPTSVQISREMYSRPNLSYAVGDISEKIFPDGSLDGILNSSVLHHVTSFNNFDVARIETLLDHQIAQLKQGGVLIIRDFVIPDGPETVYLDLPFYDGKVYGSIPGLSTGALFERFAKDWRSSINRNSPVPYQSSEAPRSGFVRYEISLRAAAEFVLRKDYRTDWDTELLEEYTYFTQSQFEEAFRKRGMRIVVSMPIWNPWIVRNRFQGKFFLSDPDENTLPFPPTNFLIVGQKIAGGSGVEIVESAKNITLKPDFLSLHAYRKKEDGKIFQLAERPNETVDLLPWYRSNDQIFVLAKKDFPRPIVCACPEQQNLNRSLYSGYITEPISALVLPAQDAKALIVQVLRERGNLDEQSIIQIAPPIFYYTSPGGIDERVSSHLIEIHPADEFSIHNRNYTKFQDAGTIRELDAKQTLRASQVGGMFDARLEINIYSLLRNLNFSPGPWIGDAIKPVPQRIGLTEDSFALSPSTQASFEAGELLPEPNFLSVYQSVFQERDSDRNTLSEVLFEYIVPRQLSKNTVVALPFIQTESECWIGVEHRDLPAVQRFSGSSSIATAPAWRLPKTLRHRFELYPYIKDAFERDFQASIGNCWELGGSYFSTPGVTSEIVYPFAVEINADSAARALFHWIPLAKVNPSQIQDAHLLIAVFRLSHALS